MLCVSMLRSHKRDQTMPWGDEDHCLQLRLLCQEQPSECPGLLTIGRSTATAGAKWSQIHNGLINSSLSRALEVLGEAHLSLWAWLSTPVMWTLSSSQILSVVHGIGVFSALNPRKQPREDISVPCWSYFCSATQCCFLLYALACLVLFKTLLQGDWCVGPMNKHLITRDGPGEDWILSLLCLKSCGWEVPVLAALSSPNRH